MTREHLFPFGYRDLLPYYEWVEHTLPVATAPMGLKEEIFFRGALQLGFPLETHQRHHACRLPAAAERDPATDRERWAHG